MFGLGGMGVQHKGLDLSTHWNGLEWVETPPHEIIHTFTKVCQVAGREERGREGEEREGERERRGPKGREGGGERWRGREREGEVEREGEGGRGGEDKEGEAESFNQVLDCGEGH